MGQHDIELVRSAHSSEEQDSSHEPHGELVTVRDGKVTEMLVYPTVTAALAAAGLPAES